MLSPLLATLLCIAALSFLYSCIFSSGNFVTASGVLGTAFALVGLECLFSFGVYEKNECSSNQRQCDKVETSIIIIYSHQVLKLHFGTLAHVFTRLSRCLVC